MKITWRKSMAVFMALLIAAAVLPFSAGAAGGVDYTIVSPYAAVNWDTYGQYKSNLHTHSIVSDGRDDFNAMIERHYELGYDILAMTDHATVDRSWTEINTNPFITFAMNIDTFGAKPTPLTQERYERISAGTDRGGRGMLRVPFGIEHNAAAFNNTHVNSFFADVNDGYLGGTSYYDHILKSVEEAGGLSVINHPGEYTGAKEDSPDDAYDIADPHYNYIIKKYTNLLLNYRSCVGMEFINKNDSRTKNDRKLWDILLANVIPHGRSIFAFGNSDAHNLSAIDTNWEIMVMPSNTVENLRECMETGAFFAGSRNIKNPKEVARLEAETGLVLGSEWSAESGIVQPKVTSIVVDEREDTIAITAENSKTIHWIADGEVIGVGGKIDLDDCADQIGSYVRAEIWGEGGILYSQPFVLQYDGAPSAQDFPFFDFGYILHFVENIFYFVVQQSKILSALQGLALGD